MRNLGSILLLVAVTLLGLTCHRVQRVTKTNLTYIYQEDPTIIHPSYRIFHNDESTTTLYLRVRSSEILYSKNNPEKSFRSRMVLNANVYKADDEKEMVDSDTVFMYDKGGPDKIKYLIGEMQLQLPAGSKYIAEITLDDQFRMQYVQDVVLIDKKDELSEENFLLKDENGNIQFGYAFPIGTKLFIEANTDLGDQVSLKYFERTGSLPSPPFSNQNIKGVNYQADSVTMIKTNTPNKFEIQLHKRGIYQFRREDGNEKGLNIVAAGPFFPEIRTLNDMVKPIRYITTKQEYRTITDGLNLKKGMDDFWYNVAGNAERAAEIIKSYYSRVEMTNRFFTSDREGWKTDRGLIYIIYGPPNVVFKTLHYESWVYNEKNNMTSVEFTFYKVDNPFSQNDYYLSRSGSLKSSWYRAIDNWRQGRVF